MSTAIEFNNISKQYRLGLVSTRTLSHDLDRWWKVNVMHKEDPYLKIGSVNDRSTAADSEYVWALKDIDFKVEQGDVVGIIGRNGAGKSTLLKILSKITGPTLGMINARGRIGSLLEVGTGFHSEMTGRENIFMNGAIMGMTKQEIARKFDEIVDFSGCEKYIDTPVKRYSSGMTVRLAFAVAAHLEPEILVVDEVLAVGDAEFQKKAIGKMKDVSKGEGRTVLFVSHNMGSMQQLCRRGIILDKGQLAFDGTIAEAIGRYQSGKVRQNSYTAEEIHQEWKMQLLSAEVSSSDGAVYYPSSIITIKMRVRINEVPRAQVLGFNIFSSYGYPIARSDFNETSGVINIAKGEYELVFEIPEYTFSTGGFRIVFDVAEAGVKNYAFEGTELSFDVVVDEKHVGNVLNEEMAIKHSIMQPLWLKNIEKL